MPIFDLYSKRQKRLRGEVPEVFVYDYIPETLRTRIIFILKEALGDCSCTTYPKLEENYKLIHNTLCREYGIFGLNNKVLYSDKLFYFLLYEKDVEKVLDAIELCFRCIDLVIRDDIYYANITRTQLSADEAIEELNARFKEEGIGYSFEGGQIIRVDSAYTHAEITKPTLSLLWNDKFTGAFDEYLSAHEHYKNGRNKECLVECAKAFESVLKTIFTEKGWSFKDNDTARQLIKVCFENELIPSYMQNQFSSLQNLLESGIPTIRNKEVAHGQGQTPRVVSPEITRYGLNLTGTNIIFLVELSGIS